MRLTMSSKIMMDLETLTTFKRLMAKRMIKKTIQDLEILMISKASLPSQRL
jgi:hypothetical protein